MRNNYFVVFVICLLANLLVGQPNKKHLILGSEFAGTIANIKDPVSGEKFNTYIFKSGPYVGLFLKHQFVIGLKGEYEIVWGDISEKVNPSYGLGGFVRYYPLLNPKIRLDKYSFLQERLLGYCELSFRQTNYYQGKGETIIGNQFSETYLTLRWGVNYNIWKWLHFDAAYGWDFNLKRKRRFLPKAGFELHF